MPIIDVDGITLEYHIKDCLEGMKDIPDGSIDLVLTDPPYGGVITKCGWVHQPNQKIGCALELDYTFDNFDEWDKKRIDKKYFDEMFRISKNQIIWGGNYYIDYLQPSPCWIAWDKKRQKDNSDMELAWASFKTTTRIFRHKWDGFIQEDMKDKEIKYHPTQKPLPLFVWLLEKYSTSADIILDPFLGSGTTLLACRKTGRNGIGFEINPDYEPIIRKRIMADIDPIESSVKKAIESYGER